MATYNMVVASLLVVAVIWVDAPQPVRERQITPRYPLWQLLIFLLHFQVFLSPFGESVLKELLIVGNLLFTPRVLAVEVNARFFFSCDEKMRFSPVPSSAETLFVSYVN